MFLYQIRLEDESFDLAVDDDELKIGDQLHQLTRLVILMTAGLEILTNPISQVLCLADVDDLAGRIFVDINTR